MFTENKLMDAGRVLFENNPMSVPCSVVCNHEMQCQGSCILVRKSNPIHFSSIENFISDAYLDRMDLSGLPKKSQKVGIIGSGPAGLTVAIQLAMQGYRVTIFEEKSMIGGMLRYASRSSGCPRRCWTGTCAFWASWECRCAPIP